ncbi:hypothetical protein ACR77J_04575 [Tissierella praeacuta]|uniref:hypothetical protein n=1 Tax=Tissierella praeacuta TaxID=43131 RepID=UPI003DA5B12C
MKEISREEKQATKITDKGAIAMLEYENKLLRSKLTVSSVIISVLTSILTAIILSSIRG